MNKYLAPALCKFNSRRIKEIISKLVMNKIKIIGKKNRTDFIKARITSLAFNY